MHEGGQPAAIGEAILAAILGRQDGTGGGGRHYCAGVADHPVPLLEHRNALADDAPLLHHQLQATEIAGRHVVVVDRAGDASFHLPHQQQHGVLVQQIAVEGVEPLQRRHHAAGAGAEARAHRQVLLQHHLQRQHLAAYLGQRLAIGEPAIVEDVLLGIIRQLVGVAAHGGEREGLGGC
ncbi:hypothetical protein D3C79_781220 [compost metagenome]